MMKHKFMMIILLIIVNISVGTLAEAAEANPFKKFLSDGIRVCQYPPPTYTEEEFNTIKNDMEKNFYVAIYYSNIMAETGGKLLKKYDVPFRIEKKYLIDSRHDNKYAVINKKVRNARVKFITVDVDTYGNLFSNIDINDPLLKEYVKYRACMNEALETGSNNEARILNHKMKRGNLDGNMDKCVLAADLYRDIIKPIREFKRSKTVQSFSKIIRKNKKELTVSREDTRNTVKEFVNKI